jgi:alpha-glucosidase
VYPGPDCRGSFYLDDGHSFAYRQGAFLRMQFSCETRSDGGLALRLGAHEGTYSPWWSQLHIEVHGMGADHKSVHSKDQSVPAKLHDGTLDFSLADDGHGKDLTID